MSRTFLRTFATAVVVAAIIAAWFVQPLAQKRTSSTVEPFQTSLSVLGP